LRRACPDEGLGGGERDDGVGRLVLAVQGQEDVVVGAGQALQFEALAADGDLAFAHPELGALAGDLRPDLDGPFDEDGRDLAVLGGEDGDGAGFDDPGLLAGDGQQVPGEAVLLVELQGLKGEAGGAWSSILFDKDETLPRWEVDCVTFETFLGIAEVEAKDVIMIKIDIEGAEHTVLPSMRKWLKKNGMPPIWVSMHKWLWAGGDEAKKKMGAVFADYKHVINPRLEELPRSLVEDPLTLFGDKSESVYLLTNKIYKWLDLRTWDFADQGGPLPLPTAPKPARSTRGRHPVVEVVEEEEEEEEAGDDEYEEDSTNTDSADAEAADESETTEDTETTEPPPPPPKKSSRRRH